MTITREWLSWDEPCLPQAAERIVDRFADATLAGECDLRTVLCVLPGSRAGRLLLVELMRTCAARGLRLLPPRVLTPGAMVDEVLAKAGAADAIASDHESHLAWMHGLRSANREDLRALLPEPPADDDWPAWSALAATLQSLHETLAGDLCDFAAAGEAAANMSMPGEGERWAAVAAVHEQQRAVLARAGLVDHHDARHKALEYARLAAARGAAPSRSIALIGAADLNAIQKAVLRLPAMNVIAFVHAPQAEAECFDDLGAVQVDAWTTRRLDIDDAQIRVAERPTNQVQEALRFLADLNGQLAPSQITIGLGDAALLGDLAVASAWADVAIHDPAGTSLRRSAPWRMLDAAADWLEEPRFEHLATLLRHVDVERWVSATVHLPAPDEPAPEADEAASESEVRLGHVQWLTLLDDYFAEHLQGRLTGDWLGKPATRARLRAVYAAVQSMLAPMNVDARTQRPLQAWCQPLLDVLANVYALDADPASKAQGSWKPPAADVRSIDAVLAMRNALLEVAAAAPGLQPSVNACTALRLLLDHVADIAIRPERETGSIEALGWLELHLDPAPALAILGFNDGIVPDAVTGHAFLPDSLRTALGLVNNARRYARDAYLLQAIVRSRPNLQLIVGRHSAQGDPLLPSRLLLACEDRTLVRRVRDFAEDRSAAVKAPPFGLPGPNDSAPSSFVIPTLPPLPAPTSMRVTEFSSFLRCPYRYALERLLGLQAYDDAAAELDPMSFGNLAHHTLATLRDDAATAASAEAEVIFLYLRDQLREHVRSTFGTQPLPALRLQVARLEQRASFVRSVPGARVAGRLAHPSLRTRVQGDRRIGRARRGRYAVARQDRSSR